MRVIKRLNSYMKNINSEINLHSLCQLLDKGNWHKFSVKSQTPSTFELFNANSNIQWVPQLFEHLEFFHVNKSCKIEHCSNKVHQIVQNIILSQGLEPKVSMLWRTTISVYLRDGNKYTKLCFYWNIMGAEVHILFPISKIKDADLR